MRYLREQAGFCLRIASKRINFSRLHFRELLDHLALRPDFASWLAQRITRLKSFDIGQIQVIPTVKGWLWKAPRRTTHKDSGQLIKLSYESTFELQKLLLGEELRNYYLSPLSRFKIRGRRVRSNRFSFGIWPWACVGDVGRLPREYPDYPRIKQDLTRRARVKRTYSRKRHGRKTESNHLRKQIENALRLVQTLR
jgi:hypothetical protein